MQELWRGCLRKMRVVEGAPASYSLVEPGSGAELDLNAALGRELRIDHTGRILCLSCGRQTRKSYAQGHCYPCFRDRAECDVCIFKPELCHHGDAANPCRDETFAVEHCFRPHILYASLTSGCKVGITRRRNLPTRWLDQGAVAAVPLAELPDRRAVGLVEKRLAGSFNDRTHWMTMLKTDEPPGDLELFATQILTLLRDWDVEGVLDEEARQVRCFEYPVRVHPVKVRSLNLEKTPSLGGRLQGIKGQYLLFEEGVINLRKFGGYEVSIHGD